MIFNLRREFIKNSSRTLLISFIVLVVAFFALGLYKPLFLSPKNIDFDKASEYKNTQVITKDSVLISYFSEKRTEKGVVTEMGYIAYDTDKDVVYAVVVPKKEMKKYEAMFEEEGDFSGYFDAELVVEGTLKPLTGDLKTFYHQSLDELEKEMKGFSELAIDYYVNVQLQYNTDPAIIVLGWIICGICLAICLVTGFCVAFIKWDAPLEKAIEKGDVPSKVQIDSDLGEANIIGKRVVIGRKYTLYVKNYKVNILKNEDIVWVYCYTFHYNGIPVQQQLHLFTLDGKKTVIKFAEKHAQALFAQLNEKAPWVICGFDQALVKTFKKEREEFLNIRYNPYFNGELEAKDEKVAFEENTTIPEVEEKIEENVEENVEENTKETTDQF